MSLADNSARILHLPEQEAMRREKIIWITPTVIVHLLSGIDSDWESIRIPQLDLPEGYNVRAVYFSHERNAFAFFIHHHSFEAVPMGALAPTLEPEWKEVLLEKKLQKKT